MEALFWVGFSVVCVVMWALVGILTYQFWRAKTIDRIARTQQWPKKHRSMTYNTPVAYFEADVNDMKFGRELGSIALGLIWPAWIIIAPILWLLTRISMKSQWEKDKEREDYLKKKQEQREVCA